MPIKLRITWPISKIIAVNTSTYSEDLLRSNLGNNIFLTNENGSIIIKNMFNNENRVLDVDRYIVKNQEDKISILSHSHKSECFSLSRFNDLVPQKGFKSIVIILESPHRDEFILNLNKLIPVAPAQANIKRRDTGYAIDRFFKSNILSQIPDLNEIITDNSRIIITNPIPFQASLYCVYRNLPFYRRLRDDIWKALWNVDAIKLDFLSRLKSYSPCLIINACTGGTSDKDSDGLNGLISEFLKTNNYGKVSYKTGHPSSVWFKSNPDGTPNSKVLSVCAVKTKI